MQSGAVFLYLYTVELVLKVLAMGFLFNRGAYLRDMWNVLDFVIVASGYLPLVMSQNSGGINLSGLRSLRVLRPLKTVTAIKKLRSLIITIFRAIPYLLEIMAVLVFAFLIFAIAGLQLFTGLLQNSCFDELTGKLYVEPGQASIFCTAGSCPQGPSLYNPPGQAIYSKLVCAKNAENPDFGVSSFDNIMSSFLMVYIVTTLEGWTKIMMYVQRSFDYMLWIYFVAIVFVGAFFLINLTLAVITIKFNEAQAEAKKEDELLLKKSRLRLTSQRRLLPCAA